MQKVIILTEDEFKDLSNSEPNMYLKKMVEELQDELKKLENYKLAMQKDSENLISEYSRDPVIQEETEDEMLARIFNVLTKELGLKKMVSYNMISKALNKSEHVIRKAITNNK